MNMGYESRFSRLKKACDEKANTKAEYDVPPTHISNDNVPKVSSNNYQSKQQKGHEHDSSPYLTFEDNIIYLSLTIKLHTLHCKLISKILEHQESLINFTFISQVIVDLCA